MLFLLTRLERPDYDENTAFVVRADSVKEARRLVNDLPNLDMAEGNIWQDTKRTKCRQIKTEGSKGVILRSFKNG